MAAVNREQGDKSDGLQALGAASFTYSREALPTWRTLSVDHPCTHMKLVDFSKMELIRSFLSRNLPSSCKTFGLVQTLLQDIKENGASIKTSKFVFVDSVDDINGVVVLHNADLKEKKRCNITCFVQSVATEDVVNRICRLVECLRFENVVMGGLESQLASEISKTLPAPMPSSSSPSSSSSLYDVSYSSCPYGCFVRELPIALEAPRPPTGYRLGQLRVEDAEKVNASWPYRSEGSEEMIRNMIRNTTCTGAYYENVLVAW